MTKKTNLLIAVGLITTLINIGSCSQSSNGTDERSELHTSEKKDEKQLIKRGDYLVMIAGCNDCHSPKVFRQGMMQIDSSKMLSGYDESRPFKDYDTEVALSGQQVVFNIESTAFAGPWGVSFAANLTSDLTGIGNWSFEQFKTAMQKGKWKGLQESRSLLPPMPWQNYVNMDEMDLKAIFAYLKSTTPIENRVPANLSPEKFMSR